MLRLCSRPQSRMLPNKRPRACEAAVGQAAGPRPRALTLAAALPDLGTQATARHSSITLLQAQVVLLFRKPRRNTRGKISAFDRYLRRRKVMRSSLDLRREG